MDVEPLTGKAKETALLCTARINVFEGAVRSAKTVSSLVAWIKFVRTAPPGPLLMAGRTERTLKRNIIDPLVEMLGQSRCRLVAGSGELHMLGRRIYLVGADNESSQEKIRGLSLVGAYLDETTTVPQSFFTMLLTRLSIPGSLLITTTNPASHRHWLKTDYLDKARVHIDRDGRRIDYDAAERLNLHRFTFKLADNPHLPPSYVADLEKEFTGLLRRRLVLGEWCIAEGAVYDMWDEDLHVIDQIPELRAIVSVGVDYGTANPTHAVMLGLSKDNRLVVMREYRNDPKKTHHSLTDSELSDEVRAWIGAHTPQWVAVDPSAASFKLQLYRDGLTNVVDADNSVLDGIRVVMSLLATGRLVVHRSCTELLDEIPTYGWDSKASEKGDDKPVKLDDHGCDALRYAVVTTEAIWRSWLPSALDDLQAA